VAGIGAIRYRAFLSYAHIDTVWAKWLHSRLEGFALDKELVGRDTECGPVPKALRPIFRDREDFPGGHSLNNATIAALDASAALIVLCSPVAASRPAVNEEVRLFRARHPDRLVIPVIIGGAWPDNFPRALRFELNADGSLSERPVTILGPDLREDGDGKNLGLAKVVPASRASRPTTSFVVPSARGDSKTICSLRWPGYSWP
jgi:TIR domain